MNRKKLAALATGAALGAACALWLPLSAAGAGTAASPAATAERQRLERIVAESAARTAADTARHIAQTKLQSHDSSSATALRSPHSPQLQANAAGTASSRPNTR